MFAIDEQIGSVVEIHKQLVSSVLGPTHSIVPQELATEVHLIQRDAVAQLLVAFSVFYGSCKDEIRADLEDTVVHVNVGLG